MLSDFREKFGGPVAIGFLVLIGLSFVFVGALFPSNLGGGIVAKVNGNEVGINDFENRYRNFIAENPQYVDVSDEVRLLIRRQLLDNLIRETLISEFIAEAGFTISDEYIAEVIRNTPDFRVDGKFNREQYQTFLGMQGLDTTQYERIMRQRLREQQLTLANGATAVVTPGEYRRYLNLVAEQRVVTTASLAPETVESEITVGEEEIVSFYDENGSLFEQPESADIRYILISRDAIDDSIEISEEQLAEYYEQEKNRYLQDEQRQARHILFPFGDDKERTEQEAQAILARVQAGEPFADLARQYSKDGGTASNGGDLGVLTRTQMPDELGTAVFSMNEGEVRGLVETEFGYHIVRVDDVLEPGPLPLDQVRGDLLAELREDEADVAFRALERRVSDAIFDNPDIDAVAEAAGLDVQTFDGFTRSGGGEFGGNQAAIDAVFAPRVLEDGQLSEIVELDVDSSAVFAVAEYNPATRLSLDEVRDQVEAALRAQKADALMAERAASVATAVESNQTFAEAAEAAGAVVNPPRILTRDDRSVDPSLLVAAFTSPKPSETVKVVDYLRNRDGGYTIFTVDAVLPGQPESIPTEQRDFAKLQLAQESGMNDFNAFVEELVATADVEIDDELVAGEGLLQ